MSRSLLVFIRYHTSFFLAAPPTMDMKYKFNTTNKHILARPAMLGKHLCLYLIGYLPRIREMAPPFVAHTTLDARRQSSIQYMFLIKTNIQTHSMLH